MSRRLFRKALNHIESRSCDSNISRLNNELKKTGMLSERMTTSTVLPATETQPFQAPTTSFVPDANGLTDTAARESFSAQPTYGGDVSDSSTWSTGWNSNAYLLNPNELDGETNRPLTYAPDKTPAGASGLVYGSFYFGTAIGYIDENNVFQTVLPGSIIGGYTGPNQTGLYYPEGSPQRENYERQVSYWNAHFELLNRFGLENQNFVHRQYTSYVNVWVAHSTHHHGSFESYTGPKKPGFILRQAEVPTGIPARSKYTSDPGQPRTLVLNRLDDPSAPDYYEGFMNEYFRKNLNLSGQGLDHLLLASMTGEGVLPGVDDIILLGISGLITFFGLSKQVAQSLYDYAMVMQSANTETGYEQGNETRDRQNKEKVAADQAVEDAIEQHGEGSEEHQQAIQDRNDTLSRHKKERKKQGFKKDDRHRGADGPLDPSRGPTSKDYYGLYQSYELEGKVLSEGWQSPDHTNVEKDSKTRWFNPNAGTDSAKWFDPKEVKPAYPTKAPPKMIDGYSASSNLAPKPVEKSPIIKLTKKDLLRNHKLKDSEILMMMQTIARLNKYLADHPEELIYARSRYPKHDPRLAELNWNMDQMLKASGDYLDKQFPENERLFTRIQNSIIKNIKATDPEEYKEVISTIETEKKARIIKKSHLSRKVSERERKSAFSRALKHLPTEARVQSDVTKERIEEIVKAELEYLKTIGKPKYYDWKDDGFDFSENFEDRKKSIQHFHSLIDKRIENLENALEEGMTTSEYIKQLYGEIPTITSMMSIDPNLIGSKFAQDVVQDSEKATTHAYGSHFPGSYVNSIGDFSPQSYSKVDVQAHITTDHEVNPNQGEMAHPENHVFTYQSEGNSIKWPTEFTLPDSFNDDLMWFDAQGNPQEWIHYIWPVHGHPGNYTPLDSDDDQTPFWYDPHPHNSPGSAWGFNGQTDSDDKFRLRMQYNDGRIDRRSITDTSFDVTYGAARSIDSSSFDLTGDGVNYFALATDDTALQTQFNIDPNDVDAVNALRVQWDKPRTESGHEDWQYIRSGTQTGFIDQIYGFDFPFAEYYYYNDENDFDEFTGTDGWERYHPNFHTEASFAKKIIKNVNVGDKISFSYKWYSDTWLYENDYYIGEPDYVHDGIQYADDEPRQSYFRAIIGANNKTVSIKDQWQLMGADPNLTLTDGTYTIPPIDNDLLNEHYIVKKDNGFTYPYNGTYEYTVQEGDIDAAGLFQFTTVLLGPASELEYVQVTDFAHTVGELANTGQLGKTTAAYNLGTSVAALDPNEKYQEDKKKRDKEEQERRKIEQERLKKEKQEMDAMIKREEEDAKIEQEAEDENTKIDNGEEKEDKKKEEKPKPKPEQTQQSENERIDAEIRKLEAQIKESKAKETAAIDAWNDELRATMDRHGAEWEAVLKKDGGYYPEKHKGLQARQDAEIEAIWSKEPKTESYETERQNLRAKIAELEKSKPKPKQTQRKRNKNGQLLPLPGERSDRLGLWLPNGKTESDYHYYQGHRYEKGSLADTGIPIGTYPKYVGDGKDIPYVHDYKPGYVYSELQLTFSNEQMRAKFLAHKKAMEAKYKDAPDSFWRSQPYHLNSLWKVIVSTPFPGARPYVARGEVAPGEESVDEAQQLLDGLPTDLRNSLEDTGVDWNSILKTTFDVANVALDVAAIIGILFPEPGSSAAGLARLLPRLRALRTLMKSSKSWWNRGRNKRIPNENEAPYGKVGDQFAKDPDKTDSRSLFGDDRRQRGQSDDAFDAGEKSSPIGRPDRAVLGVDLDPRSPNFMKRVKADRGGPGSSPTPLIRQTFERPVRSVRDNPKGGIAARSISRTVDESFAPKNNKNISDDIDNTIDIFIKLLYMTKLSNNQVNEIIQKFEEYAENSKELYPGQPSPNGFPDTPPPKLAPNGYHPKYGKKADRYRRLDPVSAVMMRKVGTDDPQTNKQVSDAAKKPK